MIFDICVFPVLPFHEQQAEWDNELKEVPLVKLMALSTPEWWMVVLGILGVIINGSMSPLSGILYGDVLSVSKVERKKNERHFELEYRIP